LKIKNVLSYSKNKNKMVAGNFNLFSFRWFSCLIRNFNNKIINPAPETSFRYGARI